MFAKLHLTVEAVNSDEAHLRLEGFANLHNPRGGLKTYLPPGMKEHSRNLCLPLNYDPRLLDYLSYHPERALTRLDTVALEDVRGLRTG